MPRGIKGSGVKRLTKTLDEKITEIDVLIESCKEKLAEAMNQKKALVEEREKENVEALLKVMKETGMSTGQLMDLAKSSQSNGN